MKFLDVSDYEHWTHDWLTAQGIPDWLVETITVGIDLVILALIVLIADFIARKVFISVVKRIVLRSKSKWDDHFYEQKVFRSLAHLVPAIIVFYSLDVVFNDQQIIIPFLKKVTQIYIVVVSVSTINKALKAFEHLMNQDEKYANSSLRIVSQIVRVLSFFIAVVIVISILTGLKAGSLLGVLAGASAILILIFQDTIVGLLANFQITMYDLLRVGDWVTLTKYGADGDVMAVDLTTVKIRNFDKTISTVPAKAFVNDSFVNWRGMKEAQGRRIKRNIIIDISSIRFCSAEDLDKFSKVELVKEYVQKTQVDIDSFNSKHNLTNPHQLNGRNQSNIGVYRNYVLNYLKNHPSVDNGFTTMVRQLQPSAEGVPVEVYCFANTIKWARYEEIQADIFDHLYAATSYFDLKLYQAPSGSDFKLAFSKS